MTFIINWQKSVTNILTPKHIKQIFADISSRLALVFINKIVCKGWEITPVNMGKSKTDDVLTKQAAEIKQLSDKMKEMAAKFTADLINFKKDLHVSTTSTAKGKAKGASGYITS